MVGEDEATSLPPLTFSYTAFHPEGQTARAVAGAPALLPGTSPDAELADVDGDGFPDILVAQTGKHSYSRNVGGKRFEAAVEMPNSPSVALGTAGVELSDVDGDGLVDMVAKTGTTAAAFRYFPSAGTGQWKASVGFTNSPSFGVEDSTTRLVDLDFDKRPDAFRLTPSGATWWHNNGDGSWSDGLPLPLPGGATVLDFADSRVKLVDMNGDRLLDLVSVRSGSVMYWPAKGRGLFDSAVTVQNAPSPGTGLEARLQVADLNGDGLADLLLPDTDSLQAWLLLPSGAYGATISVTGTPYASASLTEVRLGDVNGNGSTDVVWFTPSAAPDSRVQYLDLQNGLRPNLLLGVENGLGLVRTVTYTTSADEYQAAQEAKTPWTTRVPFSVQVVASTTLSDSRGGTYVTRYTYADGYYDGSTREFRGFRQVEERTPGVEVDPTLVLTHYYDLGLVAECLKGREVSTERRGADGFLFSRTESDAVARTYATGLDGRVVAGVEVKERREYLHEGNATPVLLKHLATYDDFGNAVSETRAGIVLGADLAAGEDETVVERSFLNDSTKWILGRVAEEKTKTLKGDVLTQSRRYYDGPDFEGLPLGQMTKGLVTREESWVEGQAWISVSRVKRDEFGNTVATKSPRGALREVTYDATHTFPVGESLALSDTVTATFSATYRGTSGLVDSFTDANGHVTRFGYDALQRLVAIAKPGDTLELPTSSFSYFLGTPISHLETTTRVVSGESRVTTSRKYVDGLGRGLADVVEAGGGKYVVSGRKAYSPRGSVLREWDSVFTSSIDYSDTPPDSPVTAHGYDAMGRRRTTTFPDGTRVEVRYGQLWQETWDAEDLQESSPHYATPLRHELDGQGRTVRVVEYLERGKPLTTQFVFDAAGQRRQVINALGQVTTYDVDGLGRVVRLKHPDAGERKFGYDDDGNMRLWVDAAGNQVLREYDLAQRLVSESHLNPAGVVEGHVAYHYDAASSRVGSESKSPIGLLGWVEDMAGEEYFAYDERGRMALDGRVIDGKAYVTRQAFDAMDNVVATTYPDDFKLEYQHDERGLVTAIPSILSHVEYDAQGLLRRREYTNGAVSTVQYDAHDRVAGLSLKGKDGKSLQDIAYRYDLAGTLLGTTDAVHPDGQLSATWTYGYDALYRLMNATGPAGTVSQQYDAVGNLLQKSDVGAYAYESGAHLNAVTAAGGRVLKYDANGSVTESLGRTFEWTPDGKLRGVTTAAARLDYQYDYTGQRVVKTVKAADGHESRTVYLDKYSELRDGQLVKYAYLGDSRVARIGGSLPKVVSLAGLVTGPGASAAAGLALVLALLLSMVRPVRRFARGALAVSLSLVMASCGTCGGPQGPPAGTLFYVENHLGSAVAQLDVDSKVVGESNFDVWGNPIVLTDEPYGFTGAEYDAEAGLQYLGSRYYDVKLGRFISVDEVVIDSTDVAGDDGQLLNVYSYARNTPTSLADRGGKLPHILVGALIGAAINTGIYLAKAAYNDTPITAKGALAAAVVGGVTGAVAAATGGAGLYASGAISGVVGGVLERGIETGSAAEAFSPEKMVGDAATGAVTAGIVKAAAPAVTKVVGGVVQRLGGAFKQAVEAIKPRCSGSCGTTIGCFVAGTPVLLASGVLVPIEEVVEGDQLPAANEALGWGVAHHPVVQTSIRQVDVVVDVDVRDSTGALERITTTLEHPFAVLRGDAPQWVAAGDLGEGDSIAGYGGKATVARIAERQEVTTVYNLTVDAAHTYFVGAGAALVHNGGCLAGGIVNRGGRFGNLDAARQAGEVGHHMPQNAFNRAAGRSRADGPALGMTLADHAATRTFAGRGKQSMRLDAGASARDRLARDIKDVRSLLGRKYDQGIREMLDYAKTLPEFKK